MAPEPVGNPTFTDEMVRNSAVERLGPLVDGVDGGYRVDQAMLLDALVYAAAEAKSLHSACGSLADIADDNTLRDYLNAAFPVGSVLCLERQINELLLADLPAELFEYRHDIAIDFHDVPFYGQVSDLDGWVCRGEARAGTTRFLRIATAYLMRDGLRFNLAVRFVGPGHKKADVLSTLLVWLRRHRLRISCLWLDRGFASVEVIQRLEDLRLAAVIACPIRGQQGGTKALCRGRCSYTTTYTMRSADHGACRVRLAVVRAFTTGRRRPLRARWLLYIQVGCRLSPHAIHAAYRRRFGIEASYRILGQLRPRTSSRNPATRFLFLGVGLVLINVWTSLRYRLCRLSLPARGFRRRAIAREDRDRFRLARFKDFISHAVERHRHYRDLISVLPPSPCFGNH
jgi:putative transposase